MDNLYIYNQAKTVPEEAKKPIQSGRLKGKTDINPMWRIKRLTEIFGPAGIGWWHEVVEKKIVDDELSNQRAAFVDIKLYYIHPQTGEVSKGIPGSGGAMLTAQERNGPYFSDEAFKMAETDAISVAAKLLGIAADVYFEKDRSKYTKEPEAAPEPKQTKADNEPTTICADCGEPVKSYLDGNGKLVSHTRLTKATIASFGRPLCKECAAKAAESA